MVNEINIPNIPVDAIVVIEGHPGQKPEPQFTATGLPVCNFSLAVNVSAGKDANGFWINREKPDWYAITAWKETVIEEAVQIASTKNRIKVIGSLKHEEWVHPTTGEVRVTPKVIAHKIEMVY